MFANLKRKYRKEVNLKMKYDDEGGDKPAEGGDKPAEGGESTQ